MSRLSVLAILLFVSASLIHLTFGNPQGAGSQAEGNTAPCSKHSPLAKLPRESAAGGGTHSSPEPEGDKAPVPRRQRRHDLADKVPAGEEDEGSDVNLVQREENEEKEQQIEAPGNNIDEVSTKAPAVTPPAPVATMPSASLQKGGSKALERGRGGKGGGGRGGVDATGEHGPRLRRKSSHSDASTALPQQSTTPHSSSSENANGKPMSGSNEAGGEGKQEKRDASGEASSSMAPNSNPYKTPHGGKSSEEGAHLPPPSPFKPTL